MTAETVERRCLLISEPANMGHSVTRLMDYFNVQNKTLKRCSRPKHVFVYTLIKDYCNLFSLFRVH